MNITILLKNYLSLIIGFYNKVIGTIIYKI